MSLPARVAPQQGGVHRSSRLATPGVAVCAALANLLLVSLVFADDPEVLWVYWLFSIPGTAIAAFAVCNLFRLPGTPSRLAKTLHYAGMVVLTWLAGLLFGPGLILLYGSFGLS